MTDWPTRLQVNAFAGDGPANASRVDDTLFALGGAAAGQEGGFVAEAEEVGRRERLDRSPGRLGPRPPGQPQTQEKELARADDAPEPLRRLMEARPEAPVLRFRRETWTTHLRRHYPRGGSQDLALVGLRAGRGRGAAAALPAALRDARGDPLALPVPAQPTSAVGRLALDDDALDRYVRHLVDDWSKAASDVRAAVVWTADHGDDDISHLMRTVIAEPVFAKYAGDGDLKAASVLVASDGDGAIATGERLIEALTQKRPAVVVTTSHGMTGPLDDTRRSSPPSACSSTRSSARSI